MLKKQGILSVRPYKFTRWHVGFCYFTGECSKGKVFIKVCIDKYNTIENEIRMGNVNNIHIPSVICSNFGEIDYVVNQYIETGGDILTHSHEDIVEQSVDILDALYENGIINRDVNPDNLIINNKGILMLIDYGWAVFSEMNYKKSMYSNIEMMLNKKYRNKDGSFDDAYSFYKVLKDYIGIDVSLLDGIYSRIGRLRIE